MKGNGEIHQTNHAIHLICAAAWFWGLLPVLWCYATHQRPLATPAIQALMRFLVREHLR